MIGVWTVCLWKQMGKPERVNLIELGPGRGTLMVDLLRVCIFMLLCCLLEVSAILSPKLSH